MQPEKARKIIIAIIIIIVVLLIGVLIYKFFTTGVVEITTNDPQATLTVTERPPHARTVEAKFNNKHARLFLSTGTYTVKASGLNGSSQAVVKVRFMHSEKIDLSIKPAANDLSIEPVSSFGAMFLSGDSDHLSFIDMNDPHQGHILTIDSNNHVTDRSAGRGGEAKFMQAQWKNPIDGVGLSYGIYLLNNDSIASLNPTPSPNPGNTSFTLAGDKLYVADGKKVYVGKPGENFKQIYETKEKTISVISAHNDKVLTVEKNDKARAGKVVVITASNGSTKSVAGEIYEALFSPDGSKILLNGDINGIYDTNLKLIKDVPINNSTSPKWLSDNEIVFADAKGVWDYNIDTGSSKLLANLNQIPGYINYIQPDIKNRYIYIDSQRDISGSRSFKLFRISTGKPKTNSAFINKVNLLFPYSYNDCYFDFVNFSQDAKPTIVTSGVTGVSASCKAILQQYLNNYSVDSSQLSFQDLNSTKAGL